MQCEFRSSDDVRCTNDHVSTACGNPACNRIWVGCVDHPLCMTCMDEDVMTTDVSEVLGPETFDVEDAIFFDFVSRSDESQDHVNSNNNNNNNNNRPPTLDPRHVGSTKQQDATPFGVVIWNVNHYDLAKDLLPKPPKAKRRSKKNPNPVQLPAPPLTHPAVKDERLVLEWREMQAAQKKLGSYKVPPQKIIAKHKTKMAWMRTFGRLCGWAAPTDELDEKHPLPSSQDHPVNSFKKAKRIIRGELKRRSVVLAIEKLFRRNPWLHVMLLNEVNKYDILDLYLQSNAWAKQNLAWMPGPEMLSTGGAKNAQHEFYPIVMRKSAVTYVESRVLREDKDGPVKENPVLWDKQDASFRPVIAHTVTFDKRTFHLGIVHTTPGSKGKDQEADREFFRPNEYNQLVKTLTWIDGDIATNEQCWIVGGDFYLTPEAVVVKNRNIDDTTIASRLKQADLEALQKKYPDQSLASAVGAQAKSGITNQVLPMKSEDPFRNFLRWTWEKNLPANLGLVAAVSGSNWYDPMLLLRRSATIASANARSARFFATARVADLFVYDTKHIASCVGGMMHPKGKMLLADVEDSLPCATFWSLISDHFPIGAQFGVRETDLERLRESIQLAPGSAAAAHWNTRFRLATRYSRIADKQEVKQAMGEASPNSNDFPAWAERIAAVSTKATFNLYLKNRPKEVKSTWTDPNWEGKKAFDDGEANGWFELLKKVLTPVDKEFDYTFEYSPLDYGVEDPGIDPLVYIDPFLDDDDEDQEEDTFGFIPPAYIHRLDDEDLLDDADGKQEDEDGTESSQEDLIRRPSKKLKQEHEQQPQ